MIFDFGDVAVVPFPFMDLPISRSRPALVLSRKTFNRGGSTIFAMITTAKASSWPGDIVVTDLISAGLTRDCCVRWKLFTLPNELVSRRLGVLGKRDLQRTRSALLTVFPFSAALRPATERAGPGGR